MALTETPLYSPVNHSISWEFVTTTQTPDEAYLAWATALGVSDSGSDVVFDLTGMTEVTTLGHFYNSEYAFTNKIGVGRDGCFHFDISDPAATPTGEHTISGVDGDANHYYIVTPANGASLGIQFRAAGRESYSSDDTRLISARCRSAAGVTIIRLRPSYLANESGGSLQIAMRIDQDTIKVVIDTNDKWSYESQTNSIRLARWNAAGDTIVDVPIIRDYPAYGDTSIHDHEELNISLVRRKIDGAITESVAGEKFKVYANKYDTGEYVADTEVNTAASTAYTMEFANSEPVILTARVDATKWKEGGYIATEQVYPTDPAATPYYYKCTTPGTTAASEPVWPTSAGTVTDGTVAWTFVERLIKPEAQAPLIPQLVV